MRAMLCALGVWEPDATGHAVQGFSFVQAAPTEGVMAPVRLRGPLSGGVTIHSMLSPKARETAAMEIFDCRLVLALDDFSAMSRSAASSR